MFRIPLFALPFLFISEGHMSGSLSYNSLEQIANWADAILLVRNIEPHIVHREEPLGGTPVRTFTFTSYRFTVKSVINSHLGQDVPLDIVEVQDASDEANFWNEKRRLEGRSTRSLLYESYQPQTKKVDALPERLIFVRYNQSNGRFTFVAHNSMEGPAMIPQVRKILAASTKPSR